MNIDELIAKLQEFRAKHGNLDICLDVNGTCDDLVAVQVQAEAGWLYLVNAQ